MSKPVAVVTGASRGLGFLLARELARQGHDLVICARSADGLAAARDDLERAGAQVHPVTADLSVREEAEGVVTTAVDHYGRLDVLVNNAGIIQVGPATSMVPQDFADALGVIFWGAAYPILTALPVMRRQGGGRIVTITSIGGKLPAPHLLPYTAAKFAAVGLSEGLRVELGKHGISVTTAVPGLMRTGSPRNAAFKGDRTAEHRWFTLGDSIPLLSIDAQRAARKIVGAALRGRPEVIVTPAAKVAVRLHGLAPGLSTRIAAAVDRLLPRTDDSSSPIPGHAVRPSPGWFRALTGLTQSAARRYHQYDDNTPPGRQTAHSA
ncbi:MAG: SDR family NAD(P)-dependent oxidoreductase [Pseudonocardiaceae bacterium]|nr:SDR family NAD(P)-dependent oxidoreductase [Pseudonocardiaceae bacterium]